MNFSRANRRSDPLDAYYDERAFYPCTYADDGIVAIRKQHGGQRGSKMERPAYDSQQPAQSRNSDRERPHTMQQQPTRPTETEAIRSREAIRSTETELERDGGNGEGGRVADWVQSQQIHEHVALPIHLFQAMVDRLIASEEAAEQLREAAIASIRGAYPVWKGPGGVQTHAPVLASEAESRKKEETFDHWTMQSQQGDIDAIKIHTSIADLPQGLRSRPSLDRSNSEATFSIKNIPTPALFEEPKRLDSEANSLRSIPMQPLCGTSGKTRRCQVNMLAPSLGDDALNGKQADPSSWFDCSSSQGSFEAAESGVSCGSKNQDFGMRQDSGPQGHETHGAGDAAQTPVMGSISVETLVSQNNTEKGSKVAKSSQASRVVAGLRNGVGRLLVKHRLSRSSLRQCVESDRAPVILPYHDMHAYLQIPEDVRSVAPAPKMEPRPAIPERLLRAPMTRRSAPLLRM